MVHIIRLLSAAALVSLSTAAPLVRRDSAIGIEDNGVSAPDGIVLENPPAGGSPPKEGNMYQPPKKEDNKYEPPKKEDNKYEPPKKEDNKYEPPKKEDNKYEPPKYEPPKYEPPKYEPPKYEPPKYEPPKMEESSTSSMMEESSTSSMMEESSTSSMMMEESSTMMETSSTMMMEESSTSTASYSMPTYGSGGESWGGSGYNDCVMQCAASYGMASGTWTPTPTSEGDKKDSSKYGGAAGSNGATHTIIVAPSKGVFRYVPFATNASVGDTVTFKWNAGPHTVTQSSALEVCNKTDLSSAFTSGKQDVGFTYDMVIPDEKPIWFYCGVPGHCEKGMFGGINIGQANPEGESVPLGSVVTNMTDKSSDMKAMYGYTKSKTEKNAYANNWGMGINVAGMDENAMMETMKNVLWTQTLIAANPDAVDKDKGFKVDDKPLAIPADMGVALAAAGAPPVNAAAGSDASSAASSTASSTASSAGPSGSAAAAGKPNAAVSVTSSSVAFGFVAIVATFLML